MSSTTKRDQNSGQILVLFALSATVVLLMAALVFDIGMMLVERRDQQNAADAAALAGARFIPDAPNAEATARDLADVNGYNDADANQVVNVYIPPMHGQFKGFPGFIEVQIETTRPSIFGGIIGKAAWPVGSYAVAANQPNLTFPFAMLALNPTACKAIHIGGSGTVTAESNIHSNSNGADCPGADDYGFSRTGTGELIVDAPDATCRSAGLIQDEGSGSMTCTPAPYSFVLPDPLRALAAPAQPPLAEAMVPVGHSLTAPDFCPGATAPKEPREDRDPPKKCDVGGNGATYANKQWILYPGLYPGGVRITNGAKAYLMPGLYWIGGGGFETSGDASVVSIMTETDAPATTATGGVLIYNSKLPVAPAGPITLGGTGATLLLEPLSAPSTHPLAIYNEIVIFQDRTVTETVSLNGSASNAAVRGIIYVPAAEVKLNGNGGTLTVDQVIADTFVTTGTGNLTVARDSGIDGSISGAGLVE